MVRNPLNVQVVWEACTQIHLTAELLCVRNILPTQYIGRTEEENLRRAQDLLIKA